MGTTNRTVSPTGSYMLDVPEESQEDVDDRVVSFWIRGDDTLLQVSSYQRQEGRQISARERLDARLCLEQLNDVREVPLSLVDCADVLATTGQDREGIAWLYTYAVWKDLAVFATISAPTNVSIESSWAMQSLRSLRRMGHRDFDRGL